MESADLIHSLIIICVMLILSAFFSGMEIAFLSKNRLREEIDRKQSPMFDFIAQLFERQSGQYITTILVGNNICLVIYSLYMSIVLRFVASMAGWENMTSSGAVLFETIVSTIIILFCGEFLPKSIFKNNPNFYYKFFSPVIYLFYLLLYPIAIFTTVISYGILRLFGRKAGGGAMAYTFFKSMGYEVGNSICELDKLDLAQELMEKAKAKGVKLMLPVDTKVGKEFDANTESKTVKYTEIPDGWEGFDIGQETIDLYANELKNAKTVIWNGPVGLFEFDQFAIGTNSIARTLADVDAVKIIGGGDSAAAVEKAGLAEKFTHISTGGGASLEFLEGKKLPGIEALQDK